MYIVQAIGNCVQWIVQKIGIGGTITLVTTDSTLITCDNDYVTCDNDI